THWYPVLFFRTITAVRTPPIAWTESPAWMAKKALYGRYPSFAAVIAPEERERGLFQRHANFLQFVCGESPWSRVHGASLPQVPMICSLSQSMGRAYPSGMPRTIGECPDGGIRGMLM